MTAVRIRPGPVSGTLRAPPSKSYTHRGLVVGHLAARRFRVKRPLDADDTRATAVAVSRLGTRVEYGRAVWRLRPQDSGGERRSVKIDCGESGTTLRFVTALAALLNRKVVISGVQRLSERPIDELLGTLTDLGADCGHLRGRGFPIQVQGPIRGGRVAVDSSKSSQFASALLLTLPTLDAPSTLELSEEPVSEPYIDATLAVLRHHRIVVRRRGRRFEIPGGQRVRGDAFEVPGDASSAAYLWAAAAVGGGSVRVDGIERSWPQADLRVLDLLEQAGALVTRRRDGAAVSRGTPTPFRVNLTDAPDLYPLVGVVAATTPGTSRIEGAEHVVLKESDRKSSTALLARSLGARVEERPFGLRITGTTRPKALHLPGLTDHRMVMSAAVGALAGDGRSWVGGRDAVRKSFPGFWDAIAHLSGGVG